MHLSRDLEKPSWRSAAFERRVQIPCLAAATSVVALIGIVDWVTGDEIGLSLFYLIPVAAAAWCVGLAAGVSFSVISAVVWYAADAFSGHAYSHPAIPVWNAFIRLGMFAALAVSLDRLHEALVREKRLSRSDPLTGVWNSRAFREMMGAELARCRRYGRPVSVAFIDVDDFKRVNDLLGHGAGDLVLQSICGAMRGCLREVDVVARIGGDEFGVLMPETGPDEAASAVRKIIARAAEIVEGDGWPVTLSVGVASYAAAPADVDDAIGRADALMYEAKGAGKNTFRQAVA